MIRIYILLFPPMQCQYQAMTPPLATVGIAAIGEMGAGIAKPLSAHYNYKVLTNVSDRRSAAIVATPLPPSLLKHFQRVNPPACQIRLDWRGRRRSRSSRPSRLHPVNPSRPGTLSIQPTGSLKHVGDHRGCPKTSTESQLDHTTYRRLRSPPCR